MGHSISNPSARTTIVLSASSSELEENAGNCIDLAADEIDYTYISDEGYSCSSSESVQVLD